jgi:2-methylisocitrate lyase-like PEP mutase family enzyme
MSIQQSTAAEHLRSLHRPGTPLLLPNTWDVATARAVVAAGFPVVATTSAGIAASLGYDDHEGAPAAEMLAAAARIADAVDVPVTVDAESGYGMAADELVAALRTAGAAGANLEDSDHRAGALRSVADQAAWLREVRDAAGDDLVLNARIDVFLAAPREQPQHELVPAAVERARAYAAAGVDCVFPIALWQRDALEAFLAEIDTPVNVLAIPPSPSLPELADLGVARISWGGLLHHASVDAFAASLAEIAAR